MRNRRRVRVLGRLTAAAALAGLIGVGQLSVPQVMSRTWARPTVAGASVSVIVQASPGSVGAARRSAEALGGRVTRPLGIIGGFAARVPASALPALRSATGVLAVSLDGTATPMATAVVDPVLGYDPADTGSLNSIAKIVGAPAAWTAGYTGKGIDVAVIDTGVTRVPGLAGTGQVLDGPDLSFDSQNPALARLDSYGHGTFMAGLIAGRDGASGTASTYAATYSDPSKFVGIAPDARVVNVKVGASDGATDVSQVIAAIDWVVQHAHDPGVNIKVLSLSYGSTAAQSYLLDPLAQAAEQAWKHGIVVVAAAGNDGKTAVELANPAYDPYLLAVGSDDPQGTLTTSDDKVSKFAEHGTTARPVDVIAPGAHVIGLRVPGSFVDTLATNTGKVSTRFQRGSGTSQATAITAGIAALAVQKYPTATPDQIKALLRSTAVPLSKTGDPILDAKALLVGGNGIANAGRAVTSALPNALTATQLWASSTGAGTLDGARGGVYVIDNGIKLTGQKDIFGKPYDSLTMATLRTQARTWTAGTWNGSRWAGDTWTASRWADGTWTGTDWTGRTWVSRTWVGMTWDGSRWAGTGWTGSRWVDSTWTGSRWASNSLD